MAEPGAGPSIPPGAERVVFWHRRVLRAQKDEPTLLGASTWTRTVVGRCLAGGAEVVAQISGTVVATFDPAELPDAIDIALDLTDEADDAGLSIAIAISFGETADDQVSGPPFERAELLAFRAHGGEVALDGECRSRARGSYLFARQLAGTGAKGYVIDRTHPRRDAAGDAMARLGPIVVPSATAALEPHLAQAVAAERQTVVLRGPPGAGAHELCERVAAAATPPRRVIALGSAPGGLVPLASLRIALEGWPGDAALSGALAAVRDGALPARETLAQELAVELSRVPTIVLFAPLSEIDAATLDVVVEAREQSPGTTLVARLGVDAAVPGVFSSRGTLVQLTLPLLRTADAREVARGLLGEATDADLVRRLAVVGGDSALGVAEAVRTFVSCGDLVYTDGAFTWRGAPRGGASSMALDVLIAERSELLDDESRRLLEAAAVLGEGAVEADLVAVAKKDGIGARASQRALGHLDAEAWMTRVGPLGSVRFSSAHARRFVVHALPPSRRAELHRFALDVLARAGEPTVPRTVLSGWHTLEGGRDEEGGVLLLAAAQALHGAGYALAAAQVASVARRGLADDAGRAAADALSAPLRDLAEPSVEVEIPAFEPDVATASSPVAASDEIAAAAEDATSLIGDVRAAIRARDPEALDRLARQAVLEGSDMDAVARLRALADLLRGDIGSAARGLVRARSLRQGPGGLRALVAESMVALRAGAVPAAIRLALRALAEARRGSDARGEAVSLFTLAACYRALGREPDAVRLETLAHA